ncbi:SHIPPO 1-like protein [Spironucleus salmonicida]|uniref:SHIPPO 1-like protein n=1 Tax=Spironucleus salmonicida TaxID=348837 RepID=V6M4D8_9EUKA|nr:SHIPPO 1-like protein [Spironucleus salmonicida]|eukprot:EST48174.1 SHIPPO 1-like protein [Spironucleus salmonicida]
MCDVEDCGTMFVPGPGAYSPNIKSTTFNSGSPEFTMKGRYNTQQIAGSPGPGAYNIPGSIGKRGASLAGRTQMSKISDVPGPGTYSPQRKSHGAIPSFAGRTQIDFNKNDTPAPCTYNVTEYTQLGRHAPKISMAGRTTTHVPESGPGFAYDPKLQKSNIGTTLAGRTTTGGNKNDVPGPGTYSINTRSSSPSHSLASRTVDMSQRPTHDVGPGAYESPERAFKYTQKGYGGSSLAGRTTDAFSKGNANPGPGTYGIPSQFNRNGAGSSLAGRTATMQVNNNPGPNTYSISPKKPTTAPSLAGRTFKPGVQDWEIRKKMDAPSPDTYNLNGSNRGKQISMSGRTQLNTRNDNPGPGTYSLKGDFDRAGVGSSLAGRTNALQGDKNPGVGPGSYMLKSTLKSGGISISGRPKKRGGIIFD